MSESSWSTVASSPIARSNSPPPLPWTTPSPRQSPPPASQIQPELLPLHTYRPLPLDVGAIRLFRLRAADPEKPGLPVGSLETHFVDLHPPYCSLSYGWDSPEDVAELAGDDAWLADVKAEYGPDRLYGLVLDGAMFGIRRNLMDFISNMARQLADPAFVGYDLFWIDAICINQRDIEERNEQVSMMRLIYREANRVLVWLGEDDRQEMPVVKDMIYKVLDMGKRVIKESERLELSRTTTWLRRIDQPKFLAEAGLPTVDDSKWWPFCVFWQRGWFSRLWILQEVALAKEIVMLCGDTNFEIIDLDDCAYMLRWGLDLRLSETWSIDRNGQFRPIARSLHRVCQILRWCQLHEHPCSGPASEWLRLAITGTTDISTGGSIINHLLDVVDGSKFSVPVDNYYALMGIFEHLAPGQSLPIKIDYSIHPADVRIDMVSYIMKSNQWLNLLCRVQHEPGPIESPSWTPALREFKGHNIYLQDDFNASRSLCEGGMDPSLPSFDIIHRRELHTSAFNIDVVSHMCAIHNGFNAATWEDGARVAITCNATYEPTKEPIATAFWKTFSGRSEDNTSKERDERIGKSFQAQWTFNYATELAEIAVKELNHNDLLNRASLRQHLHRLLARDFPDQHALNEHLPTAGFPNPDAIVDEILQWDLTAESWKTDEPDNAKQPVFALHERGSESRLLIGRLLPGRKLIRTRNGYLGLVSEAVELGHEVWLLPRMTVPIVLGRVSNYFDDGDDEEADKDGEVGSDVDSEKETEKEKKESMPTYVVLGEAYVYGVMGGELIDKWKEEAESQGRMWSWDEAERIRLI